MNKPPAGFEPAGGYVSKYWDRSVRFNNGQEFSKETAPVSVGGVVSGRKAYITWKFKALLGAASRACALQNGPS